MIFDQYDYTTPQQILGLLIFIGIPLMVIFKIYLDKIRKIKHVKVIFGAMSIILGSIIIIIAIWGHILWRVQSEYRQYKILGPGYEFAFLISIISSVGLITYGMVLIHKSRTSE